MSTQNNTSYMPLAETGSIAKHKHIFESLKLDLKIAADGHPAIRGAAAENICRSLYGIKGRRGKELTPVMDAAAAVWCHEMYFSNLLTEDRYPSMPEGGAADKLKESFGSVGNFFYLVRTLAGGTASPGFLWMCKNHDGRLGLSRLSLYSLPDIRYVSPLMCIDLWEHAYMDRWGTDISGYADAYLRQADWGRIFGE